VNRALTPVEKAPRASQGKRRRKGHSAAPPAPPAAAHGTERIMLQLAYRIDRIADAEQKRDQQPEYPARFLNFTLYCFVFAMNFIRSCISIDRMSSLMNRVKLWIAL
jgi:hypothetical protein